MVRDFRWYTTVTGHSNADEITTLYSGPGTVWRIVGQVLAASADTDSTQLVEFFGYGVSVGTAAPSVVSTGEDGAGVLLRGAGMGVKSSGVTWASGTPVVELDSEGRRVIGAGEAVRLRLTSFNSALTWTWRYWVRVLILLPDV